MNDKELFELFQKLTTSDGVDFSSALHKCLSLAKDKATAAGFETWAKHNARTMLDALKEYCKKEIDKGADGVQVLQHLEKQRPPAYLLDALKKELKTVLNINAPQESQDTLEMYLQNNIALIPEKDKRPLIAYSKEPEKMITDSKRLEEWKQKGVKEFGFIPSASRFICIDLDKGDSHANKADGVENFKRLIQSAALNEKSKEYFAHFPDCFPCYTQTANGGLHLYFRAHYITSEIKQGLDIAGLKALNIEIKYNDKVTAAGTQRNGKKYILRGNLAQAPEMTFDIIEMLNKPRPTHSQHNYTGGKKWNDAPETILAKAQELYSGQSPHDFIYRTAVLFHNAGFDKQTAERYITQTPQAQERKDKSDTQTAINSIYA